MDCCYVVCPWCQINVGFLSCCTCHKVFDFQQCNGLPLKCPICINIKLETYYQSEDDVEIHNKCFRNSKRMYYHCECCNGYFCKCVEKQLKKPCILKQCPTLNRCAPKVRN